MAMIKLVEMFMSCAKPSLRSSSRMKKRGEADAAGNATQFAA